MDFGSRTSYTKGDTASDTFAFILNPQAALKTGVFEGYARSRARLHTNVDWNSVTIYPVFPTFSNSLH